MVAEKLKNFLILVGIAGFTLTLPGCSGKGRSCEFDEKSQKLNCIEKSYQTTKLANSVWLAENLNYMTQSSFCYENSAVNCSEFGQLYPWNSAMATNEAAGEKSAQGVCPQGWHVPSLDEFKTALQNGGLAKLNVKNGGFRYYDSSFVDKGRNASFWTSTEYDGSRAFLVRIEGEAVSYEHFNKHIAGSLRCVKD